MVREINIIGFKNGKCVPQAKECEWSLEATVGKKMDSPLAYEETQPYQHHDFSPGRPRADLWLYKITKSWHVKPSSLW